MTVQSDLEHEDDLSLCVGDVECDICFDTDSYLFAEDLESLDLERSLG